MLSSLAPVVFHKQPLIKRAALIGTYATPWLNAHFGKREQVYAFVAGLAGFDSVTSPAERVCVVTGTPATYLTTFTDAIPLAQAKACTTMYMNCEGATAAELDALIVDCYAEAQAQNIPMWFIPVAQRWYENRADATRMTLWTTYTDGTAIQTQGWAQAGVMDRFAPTIAAIKLYRPDLKVLVQISSNPSGVDWSAEQMLDLLNTYIVPHKPDIYQISVFYNQAVEARWTECQEFLDMVLAMRWRVNRR